jgi:rod shape determining protein RodA
LRKSNNNIVGLDWKLIFLYLLLVFIGWINIYSASKTDIHYELFDFSIEYGKQLIWIGFSILLIIPILFLDIKFYMQFSSIIYLLSILSLIGLFAFGKTVNGATSWYSIGSFTLQPTEFTKIAVSLGIAKLLGDKQFDMKYLNNQAKAILLLVIPSILIILQPDPGSALVYFAFFFVFYREGLPRYYIIMAIFLLLTSVFTIKYGYEIINILLLLLFIGFLIYTHKYKHIYFRKYWMKYIAFYLSIVIFIFGVYFTYHNLLPERHVNRINLALNIVKDTKGKGYNIDQSVIAIGSGGFKGKGFLQGTQTKGGFVPEQHTDFIFSTVGEEWGFIGSTVVILLFIIFILRIIKVAEMQKSKFSRIYGYSIASIFFIHFFINIGMVIGLVPTIGIPLPFFSYGGSSLWAFTILLFIFIRLDANKNNEW